MTAVTQLLVGVFVVICVLGGIILASRRGWLSGDDADARDRDTDDGTRVSPDEYRIPIRHRVKAYSTPLKVFATAVVAVLAIVLYGAYTFFKTGAAPSNLLSQPSLNAVLAALGVYAGIRIERWLDAKRRLLHIRYENPGGRDRVETVPYRHGEEEITGDGVVVKELAKRRIFGLFSRYVQVGEDRELRTTNKPLGDVVRYLIPDHAAEIPGVGFMVTTRKDGDEIMDRPDAPADRTVRTRESLSTSRSVELREQNRRHRIELNEIKSTNATLYRSLRNARKEIKNMEVEEEERLLKLFDEFTEKISRVQMDSMNRSRTDDDTDTESVVEQREREKHDQ